MLATKIRSGARIMNIPAHSKRNSLRTLVAGALLGLATLGSFSAAVAADDEVVMYKDPNCGCCGKWAAHMREHGFKVKEVATTEMAQVKGEAGVPQALGSCHTAKVGGYVVEGHVPAREIRKLLRDKPAALGISVPAMPCLVHSLQNWPALLPPLWFATNSLADEETK